MQLSADRFRFLRPAASLYLCTIMTQLAVPAADARSSGHVSLHLGAVLPLPSSTPTVSLLGAPYSLPSSSGEDEDGFVGPAGRSGFRLQMSFFGTLFTHLEAWVTPTTGGQHALQCL